MAVTLDKLAFTLDLGDIEYDRGRYTSALKTYTKFVRMLNASSC